MQRNCNIFQPYAYLFLPIIQNMGELSHLWSLVISTFNWLIYFYIIYIYIYILITGELKIARSIDRYFSGITLLCEKEEAAHKIKEQKKLPWRKVFLVLENYFEDKTFGYWKPRKVEILHLFLNLWAEKTIIFLKMPLHISTSIII